MLAPCTTTLISTNNRAFLSAILLLLFICLPSTFAAAVNLQQQGNEDDMICIPNATFHIDCNMCKCSPSGMSIDCTEWTCATLKIPYDLLLNLTLKCEPGEVFLYNRHKCLCSTTSQNHALCSSARFELAHNLRPTSGSIISLANSLDKCTPGLVFKNSCDTCICAEDGLQAACLGIHCLALATSAGRDEDQDCIYPAKSMEKLCVPYSIFSIDCNQCICSSDGLSYTCDTFPCIGVEMRDDQILNITFLCESGSTFLYNQYECLCSVSGKYALCSLATYDKSLEFRESNKRVFSIAEFMELCTPGMTFKDKCNICICGANEKAACTKLDCDLSWKYTSYAASFNPSRIALQRIIPQTEIWTQQPKNSRFCRRNDGSRYCRYLRKF